MLVAMMAATVVMFAYSNSNNENLLSLAILVSSSSSVVRPSRRRPYHWSPASSATFYATLSTQRIHLHRSRPIPRFVPKPKSIIQDVPLAEFFEIGAETHCTDSRPNSEICVRSGELRVGLLASCCFLLTV